MHETTVHLPESVAVSSSSLERRVKHREFELNGLYFSKLHFEILTMLSRTEPIGSVELEMELYPDIQDKKKAHSRIANAISKINLRIGPAWEEIIRNVGNQSHAAYKIVPSIEEPPKDQADQLKDLLPLDTPVDHKDIDVVLFPGDKKPWEKRSQALGRLKERLIDDDQAVINIGNGNNAVYLRTTAKKATRILEKLEQAKADRMEAEKGDAEKVADERFRNSIAGQALLLLPLNVEVLGTELDSRLGLPDGKQRGKIVTRLNTYLSRRGEIVEVIRKGKGVTLVRRPINSISAPVTNPTSNQFMRITELIKIKEKTKEKDSQKMRRKPIAPNPTHF